MFVRLNSDFFKKILTPVTSKYLYLFCYCSFKTNPVPVRFSLVGVDPGHQLKPPLCNKGVINKSHIFEILLFISRYVMKPGYQTQKFFITVISRLSDALLALRLIKKDIITTKIILTLQYASRTTDNQRELFFKNLEQTFWAEMF